MQALIDSSTVISLQHQIGKYKIQEPTDVSVNEQEEWVQAHISLNGQNELYKGISEYQNERFQKIKKYLDTYDEASDLSIAKDDAQFFRKKFIEFLQQHSFPEYKGNPHTRGTNPEAATIEMKELLGKKGFELFEKALEEEMNSKEFRDAVVYQSTSHFEGPKWEERPIVIVAGPSGCGKSFAAKAAVEKSNQFLKASPTDLSGNYVVAADGGIIREVSQMRKLVIQLANNQGYSGIKDLHSRCKILEKVKNRVREAAFLTTDLGVVIPETFSQWDNPLSDIRSLMPRIDSLPNTKQIFSRVEGKDQDNFREIVAFMGSRRAWKTNDFTPSPLDLNKTGLTESKAYGHFGFKFGVNGSKNAEEWIKNHSKDKLHMVITNDLILLKPDPAANGKWIPAKQNDEGARLFSESLFNQWQESQDQSDLVDYCKSHSKSQIAASPQLKFGIAKHMMEERIEACHGKMKATGDEDRSKYLEARLKLLQYIDQFSANNLESYNDIQQMKKGMDFQILMLKRELGNNWPHVFTKKTEKALEAFRDSLDSAALVSMNTPMYYTFKKQYETIKSEEITESESEQEEEGSGACP